LRCSDAQLVAARIVATLLLTDDQIVATTTMTDPIAPYDWDEAKRAANIADHKLDFTAVYEFDWDTAVFIVDDREDYGELRESAIGFIGVTLHVVVFTERGQRTRIISLRKAGAKDVTRYVEEPR
jgi:uncharacterized DUF497 family protein